MESKVMKYVPIFNSPLETGVRSLIILVASYPTPIDTHRLVQYDYLVVHSEDAKGPPSLHPALPLRSNELLVRRDLIDKGLLLMSSRGLIKKLFLEDGIKYQAEDQAGVFLDNLRSSYLVDLNSRAQWAVDTFSKYDDNELKNVVNGLFKEWTVEFQSVEFSTQLDLEV